jgi:hypothetical protein
MYYSPNRALRGRSTYRNITDMRYIALRVPAPKELSFEFLMKTNKRNIYVLIYDIKHFYSLEL